MFRGTCSFLLVIREYLSLSQHFLQHAGFLSCTKTGSFTKSLLTLKVNWFGSQQPSPIPSYPGEKTKHHHKPHTKTKHPPERPNFQHPLFFLSKVRLEQNLQFHRFVFGGGKGGSKTHTKNLLHSYIPQAN